MLKPCIVVFLFSLLFVSCDNREIESEKPSDLLDKNKMAAVMTDFTLMEAAANLQFMQNPNTKVDTLLKFNVYKQHMISRNQYEASLNYYSSNPTEFKEVYEMVLQNLNKQKGN